MDSSNRSEVGNSKSPATWELYAYGLARTLVHIVNRSLWRTEVIGAKNLPKGPFILAPVHRSNIDTLLVASITTRRLRYMGKDGLWHYKLAGAVLSALGGFPVHRGIADRDAMTRCISVLSSGEPLVLFPEGTRNSGPVIDSVFEGAAYIALKARVPIVPVGIGGSERAWKKGKWFPRFTKIVLIVGDPIFPPEKYSKGERTKVKRSELDSFSAVLTSNLQDLFDQSQKLAKSY